MPIHLLLLPLVLSTVVLAGCGLTHLGEEPDLGPLDDAVISASERVVAVEDSARVVDGLGHALVMTLRFDRAAPPSPDELDTIVRTIWRNVPWEPNGITLVVGSVGTVDLPVDLEAGAADLEPMRFTSFGQGGVNLVRFEARYGEWQEPE